ncbi:hypothetical protein [Phycicoccus duodecadis]|uniref:ABC-2 type transport system permease protein n=1 Tax=Phycicoccus duodecadis TaxID=173053 RepID=A0A2N3YL73_9MICO|nr:hypothetical protein [Phycicoccus duodecadis]PKW27610.1 hypothetical protein ATL31_2458 [Phycicoccus duodecadis]
MTDGDGRHRLRDAEHVLHGPEGSGAWRRLLYAVYVVALLAGLYGFTIVRALVEVVGPTWRAQGLVGPIAAAAGALLVALLALGHLAGRRRGPVTPDLPWIEHVVASSVDRRLTLRDAWRLPVTGLAAGGTVVGGVLGAALWAGGATGPVTAVVGVVGGLATGVALAVLWLAGQVVSDPAVERRSFGAAVAVSMRPRAALRGLGLEGLRAHSARSSRLGGAVLAGDPRAMRLEAASPVRRGRSLRLRSRGRERTLVARDLLGMRRQPLLLVGGLALVVPGTAAAAWSLAAPSAPVAGLVVGVLLAQLGGGLWGEGLRLQGDTLGAPRLLGGSVEQEALAHSVLPVVLFALAGATGAVPVTLLAGGSLLGALLVVLVLALTATAAQWVAAFRVGPPTLAFAAESGAALLVLWWAWPLVLGVVVGTLALAFPGPVAVLALGALAMLARRSLQRAAVAHRD